MKKTIIYTLLLSIIIFVSACTSSQEPSERSITIGAAASLTNPMKEIIANYERDNPNANIILNFAASGSLLKQIEEGAPIDIFISASDSKFEPLLDTKISKENSLSLLSNSMALISYKDKKFLGEEDNENFSNFTDYSYSIGDINSVPAGRYAYEILSNKGIWTDNNQNQITAKSVRQVLNYVESKNVEYGIVYLSDAFENDKVEVLKVFEDSSHSKINYPIGIIDEYLDEESKKLYDYIISDESIKIFENYGFKKAK